MRGKWQACPFGLFKEIWIQPAAGDAGGALGAALYAQYQLLENNRNPEKPDSMGGAFLGPSYNSKEIDAFLKNSEAIYEYFDDERLLATTVDAIEEGQVVGWFQGRMEFGPRALGSRSILGDPRNPKKQAKMNLSIKYRESFRPFAPVILAEYASEYFDIESSSPYMLFVTKLKDCKLRKLEPEEEECQRSQDLIARVNVPRSELPAITHVDMSARIQTVDNRHGSILHLLRAFKAKTGCPALVNTSFNVRGEPIVCSPQEAYNCFMATEMDILVLGNYILHKEKQSSVSDEKKHSYLNRFELD